MTNLVKKLTETGMGKAEAEEKIKAMQVAGEGKGLSKPAAEKSVVRQVKKYVDNLKRNEEYVATLAVFNGTCVAVGELRDVNDKARQDATQAYLKDPKKAEEDGWILMDPVLNRPIILDNMEFWPSTGKPNGNYGKELKTNTRRDLLFLIDGIVTKVVGNDDAIVGHKCEIRGTQSDTSMPIYLKPVAKIKDLGEDESIIDTLSKTAYVDVAKITEKEMKSTIIIRGMVAGSIRKEGEYGEYGGLFIESDNPESPSLAAFSSDGGLIERIGSGEFEEGDYVYAIGRVKSGKGEEGAHKFALTLLGAFNDSEASDKDLLSDLDKILG